MKLGFRYTITSTGFDDQKVVINPEGWSDVVRDVRKIWLKYSQHRECVAMTFVKDGIVLAISRVIGGDRPDNNCCTWVHIPAKIKISGAEILSIINAIKEINKMSSKEVSEDTFKRNDVLFRDYPERKVFPFQINNQSNKKGLAYRHPSNDFTLTEILNNPYQSYYSGYEFVFIYDEKPDLTSDMIDLSGKDIIEEILVFPPSKKVIHDTFGTGVSLYLSNGILFKDPQLVNKNASIKLFADKQGCVQIPLEGQAIEDEKEIEIKVQNRSWRRVMDSSYFKIVDSNTDRTIIPAHSIEYLSPNYDRKTNSIPENALDSVKLEISAFGYETFKGEKNLSNPPVIIKLKKIKEQQKYKYVNKDNEELTIEITGPGAKSQYPIEGYSARNNRLKFEGNEYNSFGSKNKNKFSWKSFILGVLSTVLLLLITWCGFELYKRLFSENDNLKTINTPTEIYQDGNLQADNPNLRALDAAIKYLDSTDKWERDSLIKYPVLEGLFEELNEYKFQDIKKRKENLKGSKKFMELFNEIGVMNPNDFTGPYNGEGDLTITVSKYILKLRSKKEQTNMNPSSNSLDSKNQNPPASSNYQTSSGTINSRSSTNSQISSGQNNSNSNNNSQIKPPKQTQDNSAQSDNQNKKPRGGVTSQH